MATPTEPIAPEPTSHAEAPSSDGWSSRLNSVVNASTAFMALAAKEWFGFLLYQPTSPPFQYSSRFNNEFDRVVRLVVVVIVLTAVVLGSASLIYDKRAVLIIVTWAMWVLIGAFLTAIVYHVFAFLMGVRRCHEVRRHAARSHRKSRPLARKLALMWTLQTRRKLTLGQIIFSVLYIFVPWIPIYAFLRGALLWKGMLELIVVLLIYICAAYMFFNFAKAIKHITCCPWYRVWASLLLPIVLILSLILFRA
jgi:hypothetical protein